MPPGRPFSFYRAGRRLGQLSAVLTPSRPVRDGETVEVVLGDGRTVAGQAWRLDDGKIRVILPEGYA